MNILIPYSWLKEYLETQANPQKIADYLSLCGPSVERINKIDNHSIYDIEVTTNRVDCMSVAGIAREIAAILPQFKTSAKFKNNPYEIKSKNLAIVSQDKKLKVIIKNKTLCPRFTAVILENITIKPSSPLIQERLRMIGMRPLNNVIDISNYLMHEFGQPVHIFDYDKIGKQTMILRESRKGEVIITLDAKQHLLLGGDIIIEDGRGQLIDLCGIMGGKNSAVDKKTKRVLLFVQNYESTHIRKTSMKLAHRTQAATLFEKTIDPKLVMPTLLKGIQLIKELAGGKIASKIIDIYPEPYQQKVIQVSLQLIEQRLGIKLAPQKILKILNSLGFNSEFLTLTSKFKVSIPSWRAQDVNIPEDIIEEVARIYGYHNLPSLLAPLWQQPAKPKTTFAWEEKIKDLLKNWGLTEVYTYSMQSEEEIKNFGFEPQRHLKLKNPFSLEWTYMRTSLVPSILSVIEENKGRGKELKIFELANIYLPQKNNLPQEKFKLIMAFGGKKYYQLKGICEGVFNELGIKNIKYSLQKTNPSNSCWNLSEMAAISAGKNNLGFIGTIKPQVRNNFSIEEQVTVAYLDFEVMAQLANKQKTYKPCPKYPTVIEDLTFIIEPKTYIQELIQLIKSVSLLIQTVELIDSYKSSRTFRISYQDPEKNLSSKEISHIRKKIIASIKEKGWGQLKG